MQNVYSLYFVMFNSLVYFKTSREICKCGISSYLTLIFRSVWRIHLERGEYDKAMAITDQLKDRAPHQLVLKKQADKFITEKK